MMPPAPAYALALPYGARLVCLCLAAGFCVYFLATLLSAALAPVVLRRLARAQWQIPSPARSAAWLLALRLLPLTLSSMVVVGLCLPSYLWLEPHRGAEEAGFGFLLASLAGALLAAVALRRALGASLRSWRYVRRCARGATPLAVPGVPPAWIIPDSEPLMALSGVLRPRLLVSRSVLSTLSPDQLQAGLRHERAHLLARDNVKRLLLIATPILLPAPALHALDLAWARLIEWAADDRSVQAGPLDHDQPALRSLALASALLSVARMGAAPSPQPAPALISCLRPASKGGEGQDLADRVQRLLAPRGSRPAPRFARLFRVALGVAATLALGLMLQPATLISAHEIIERLLH